MAKTKRKPRPQMIVTSETGVGEISEDFLPATRPDKDAEIIPINGSSQPALTIYGLPPMPVFDEHIANLLAEVKDFVCRNLEEFQFGREWREQRAGKLKGQIAADFKTRKQAFDRAKQPTLDAEAAYLTRINVAVGNVDSLCIPWQREEKRKADEEAARKRQQEIDDKIADQKRRADLLREFGEPEKAKEEEEKPIIPPRQTAPEVPTYARGVRTKEKLVAHITNPSEVKREFCLPAQSLVNAKVSNFTKYNQKPTEEQIKALADEIGGVELVWE